MSQRFRQIRLLLLIVTAGVAGACDETVLVSGSVIAAADSTYPAALEGRWADSSESFHADAVEARASGDVQYSRRGYLLGHRISDSISVWLGGAGIARVGPSSYLVELSHPAQLPDDARFRATRSPVPGPNTRWTDPRVGSEVAYYAALLTEARIPVLCRLESPRLRCEYLRADSVRALMERRPGSVPGVWLRKAVILDGEQLGAERLMALFYRPGFAKHRVTLIRKP